MAHSLSAKKRISAEREAADAQSGPPQRSKNRVRAYTEALTGGDSSNADEQYRKTCALLDREASRGLIHRNAAARRKSRLARRLNALKQKASA